jgi:hypothetical protein
MTVPTGAATNIAGGAATVGVQTQAVHGDVTVYQLASNASPAEKYRIGLNYLDGGMPAKAQELIGDAIMEGYDTSEALFHWMLALLSGRTFRQFSEEDFSRFRAARERLPQYTGDQWSNGLKVINHLLDSVETSEADLRLVIKELDALGVAQRDKIVRHLEMFLKGPIEDQIWARVLAQVEIKRMGRGRKDRVWMFFQPKPAVPRVRQPDPVTTTMTAWFWVTMATTLFMATAGYIGWLLLARGEIPALFAYLISVAGGYTCFVKGLEWRDRVERLRVKEEERRPPSPQAYAPQGGFADNVDKLFNRYFARYMPEGADRRAWLAATAGTRRYLRDEIVDVYREKRVDCEKVAWLIRYRIREVEQRWQDGTLWDYRDQLRTSAATKLAFALGLVPLVLGGVWAIDGAIRANPLLAITAAVFLAGSGYVSAIGWLRIKLERRRFKAEYAESQQRLADSMAALDRWQKKLAPKPSDSEMATWLDCDRKYLMDQTMRHYKLAPSQVIAHAFIEAPAASYKRARVPNGPWRYSRYQLLVFLLTTDGVRQLTADLDLQKGTFHDRKRVNYRFDAVAAVQVTETDDHRRTFELTLVNGQPITVTVTESSTERTEQLQQGEDPGTLSRLALDATGLSNTLHVLEGVAAEGKEWIKHENQRRTTD